ncbi:MAG: LuxR C-terminal-related transcriptional regulator [Shinella sp.]|nr:LuxR C-terminal-related transcriptional regulator [Shinella sp.]
MDRLTDTIYDVEAELTELIYSAVLGHAPWTAFLDRLNGLLPDGKSTFMVVDRQVANANVALSSGWEASDLKLFNRYYGAINPWMPRAAVRPVGIGVVAEQMLEPDSLRKTEFYNDYLQRRRCESGVGLTVVREEGKSFVVTTLTSSLDMTRNRQVASMLTRLSPHLARAFRFYQQGPVAKAMENASKAFLSAIGVGVLIVRENGMVRLMNAEAQKLIENGCGIRISPTGRVAFMDEQARGVLGSLLKRGSTPQPVLTVRSATRANPFRYTFVRMASDSMSEFLNGPVVAVLIEQNHEDPCARLQALAASHGLTPAEARVAANIAMGKSINETATLHGVSRETVRSQLKSVYVKLGVRRQAELVRLLG